MLIHHEALGEDLPFALPALSLPLFRLLLSTVNLIKMLVKTTHAFTQTFTLPLYRLQPCLHIVILPV